MKKLQCVIINSQPSSVNHFTSLIECNPFLTIIKSYTSPIKALFEINESDHVYFLFMDIDMKELSGLELLKRLRDKVKFIVFVTPDILIALKAFNLSSDQHKLKPINQFKLIKTIHQLAYPYCNHADDNLFIEKENKGCFDRLLKADIILIQNKNNIVIIVTETQSITVHVNFNEVLQMFKDDFRFLQISQSYLVNLNFVTDLSEEEINLKMDKLSFLNAM
ncbi:LytR/AlgR family response regulator transcription factor [Pedobacter nototheniae]|uniref:LytR/AlgR family response regulator transcription factor n=1 Tax=Pedobacter nototheniae TaxID=2488994 RepID=UPI00103FFB2E|nr:LytTR family transcriptional regulator DNA-binding domain-containing protein [Pedobacter nototheniae]